MSRVITVAGAALVSTVDLGSINIGAQANGGASTLSELVFFDDANSMFGTAEAFIRKQWSVTENASGTAVYLARGRIGGFDTHRGDSSADSIAGVEVQYTFNLEDQNKELYGFDVDAWVRPAETDVARVTALGTAYLNGSPRSTTNLDTTTYVAAGSAVSMPAKTYNGADVIDVLAECAAMGNKQFFVTVDHELYYDVDASTAYTASLEISDGVAGANAIDQVTYFAPIWDQGPALTWEGQDYASRARVVYNPPGTATTSDVSLLVTDSTSEANHDLWVVHLTDNSSTTSAAASAVASTELSDRAYGARTYQVTLEIPAAQAYKIKVGQLIWMQAQAAVDSTARVQRRIAELKWETAGPNWYLAHLKLDNPLRISARGTTHGPAGAQPAPAVVVPAADVVDCAMDISAGDDPDYPGTYGTYSDAVCHPWSNGTPTKYIHISGGEMDFNCVADGISYGVTMNVGRKHGSSLHKLTGVFLDAGGTALTSVFTIFETDIDDCTAVDLSGVTPTAPTGTDRLHLEWNAKIGGWGYSAMQIFHATASSTPDPYALSDPGTSPYFARSDDPRFTATDQHITTRLSREMTNASGTALTTGAVVILSAGTADNSFTTVGTASYSATRIGVLRADAIAGATATVVIDGVGAYNPTIASGTPAAGDYLFTSTTAGAATYSSTRAAGAFGQVVSTDGTAIGTVDLWGVPDSVSVAAAAASTATANVPVNAALSNPPTEEEIETALGVLPGGVPGQSWVITDSSNDREYEVSSDGFVFKITPLVRPLLASGQIGLGAIGGVGWNYFPAQQAAAYYNGKTYYDYFRIDNSDFGVRSYTHATSTVSSETVLNGSLGSDSHSGGGLVVRDSDKKIVAIYSDHNDAQLRMRISSSAESIAAFAAEVNLDSQIGGTQYTYPQIMQLLDEASDPILAFFRTDPGGASHADQIWAYSKSTDGGTTWAAQTQIVKEPGKGAYVTAWKTSESRVDLLVTDDASAQTDATENDLYHMYYEGGVFYKTNGTPITSSTPYSPVSDMTQVMDGRTPNYSLHPYSILLGADGYPRVVFRVRVAASDVRYYWGRWTGSAWSTQELCTGGQEVGSGDGSAAGVTFDRAGKGNVVYASRKVGTYNELWRYTTLDNGVSWTSAALTASSSANQTRPMGVVDAAPDLRVMWSDTANAQGYGSGVDTLDERHLSRLVTLVDTQANIEAVAASPTERVVAFSTDGVQVGYSADGTAWTWVGGATNLNSLSDVTITSAATGDRLRYNGSAWVNLNEQTGIGHYEVIVSGSSPPVAVTTEDGTDWVYGWNPA